MVKSTFPGKPSKYFYRKKVYSCVHNQDYDGSKTAEDVYNRLNVFNAIFGSENEVSSFHGFSPHEIQLAAKKTVASYRALKKDFKDRGLSLDGIKEPESLSIVKSCGRVVKSSKESIASSSKVTVVKEDTTIRESTYSTLNDEIVGDINSDVVIDGSVPNNECIVDSSIKDSKIGINVSTLSGKFVLPTRSAHSSRVIKPNKRFLENENSEPIKKERRRDNSTEKENASDTTISTVQEMSHGSVMMGCKKFKRSKETLQSPVKVILRKPRLKSQTYTAVEGPFSSSTSSGLGNQYGPRKQNIVPAKVVCGVCGTLRLYKFLRQARKFGIFSCEPCRRFILKILKMEKQKTLEPLVCNSGNGTCQIRHSALESNLTFSTEWSQKKFHGEGPRRCQACWLHLCLQSFQMPHDLQTRLTSFLPDNFNKKSAIGFNASVGSKWGEISGLGSLSSGSCLSGGRSLSYEVARTLKKKATAIARRDPPLISNTLASLASGGGLRETKDLKKVRSRQKLPVSGPRVKHVCRSASLVLGQPIATFNQSNNKNVSNEVKKPKSEEVSSVKQLRNTENNDSVSMVLTTSRAQKTESLEQNQQQSLEDAKKNEIFNGPPVARMLQDLGRVNWEMLDGIEKQETELQHAKVSIDFWESYDPEEVIQSGFSLLGYGAFRLRALCFLCGSAGHDKLVHCACCCEPYHTYCVSNLRLASQEKDWWKVNWLCPRCTHCEACSKPGGSQLTCTKCYKSYHSACISTSRFNMTDSNWLCPSCLSCKSCNDARVHVFVGNLPLCKSCFKLRKKGSFCPLCQRCYDDNDYSTKMMECAQCKSWIHAKCEGLSNEKYQVLSYLPSSIEFICRLCCKEPPATWSVAVESELKGGYLNVLKALSKNRDVCALLKSSPKKQMVCSCQYSHRNPITLPSLSDQSVGEFEKNKTEHTGLSSATIDDKNSDFGLLTPKMTKDDEESLKTVKTGFLALVNNKESISDKDKSKYAMKDCTDMLKTLCDNSVLPKNTESDSDPQLLSIAYHGIDGKSAQLSPHATSQSDSGIGSADDEQKSSIDYKIEIRDIEPHEKHCIYNQPNDNSKVPLNLMSIKNKATSDEYKSLLQFHQDMEQVIVNVQSGDLLKIYHKSLKSLFPWFDPKESQICDSLQDSDDLLNDNPPKELLKPNEKDIVASNNTISDALKGLLDLDPDYYYNGLKIEDTRMCMFCKSIGEGMPTKEERLLYCGHNEWVHANCALWSSEVFEEIDGSLQNVHSAISRARLIRCSGCSKKGASVGCCARSCPEAYHFICALTAECIFLENKEVYCKNHSYLTESKELHKEKDFHISRSVYVELDHRKKKDVLKQEVKLLAGSLYVDNIGNIVPEFSAHNDIIIPCDFKCTRLYWSSVEPWKIVQYHIRTLVNHSTTEYTSENDINYTVDHSLDFTPPPSPEMTLGLDRKVDEYDVKIVVGQLVDAVCSREEESNLSDQQATDLLPPEIKDAIFEDLPHDLLDGISMHDIFPKMMNFDDMLAADLKNEKSESSTDNESVVSETCKKPKLEDEFLLGKQAVNSLKNSCSTSHRSQSGCKPQLTTYCRLRSSTRLRELDKQGENENFNERAKENKWKKRSILQVDGTIDFSESDQSNDSCDLKREVEKAANCLENSVNFGSGSTIGFNNTGCEDKPVKCSRCHRTYRTNVSYERHLSTCNSDYLSCSESDSSEEEKSSPVLEKPTVINGANIPHQVTNLNVSVEDSTNNLILDNSIMVNNGVNSVATTTVTPCLNAVQVCSTQSSQNPKFNITGVNSSINEPSPLSCFKTTKPLRTMTLKKRHMPNIIQQNHVQHQQILHSTPTLEIQSQSSQNGPAIILQQVDNVMPTAYIDPYQHQNQPNIQYVAAIDTQEKAQYLTPNPLVPGTFHIQSAPLAQSMVQNVPTVLGTIIQPNGMEQIVVNNPNPTLEVYSPQQSGLFITNSPVYVGMETVVSNTVMSSSQFISSSIPGMLAASSYSATTTQVFQATKPILDIPQSYVVVNAPVVENNPTCIPQLHQFSSPTVQQQPVPWTNYQVNFQEAYKVDKSASYQTVTRQIIHEEKQIDGVKMINSTQETIVIEPMQNTPNVSQTRTHQMEGPVNELSKLVNQISSSNTLYDHPMNNHNKQNVVKIVELPSSPAIDKEKPQKAVAPVVVKKVSSNVQTDPIIPVCNNNNNNLLVNNSITPKTNLTENSSTAPPIINKVHSEVNNGININGNKKSADALEISNSLNNGVVHPKEVHPVVEKTCVTEPKKVLKPSIKYKIPINILDAAKKVRLNHKTTVKDEPKITYEVTSEDGFSYTTTNILEAWQKVFDAVQITREGKGLPPLSRNPFNNPEAMLKKIMGLGSNSMKFILEQLPGIEKCVKYKPVYHRKELSALDYELARCMAENPTGCARTEPYNTRRKYDMFSWLASRHRRPPKLLTPDNDNLNVNSRRATSLNLPMAMRFRHLKVTSKLAVGVFRSDIHGRGLFCLRDIESGEMVIEYAGEVIRSALTDSRERYYTAKGIGCYMFRIDDKFVVDATMKGNAARFINHSCEPNCYSRVVDILGKKHILIFALRRIPQGEELTYDYKFPLEEEKINCHCLSRKCRKYLN